MAAELGGGALLLRSRFSGRHGPGSWPARQASSRHSHHAQERKAAQVPGSRRLLGPSDHGGLCQLGSGGGEVWTVQENCGQRCSAGSKISLWLGSVPGACGGGFPGWVSHVTSWTAVMRWTPRRKALRKDESPEKKKSKRHKEDLDGAGGEEYPMDIWLLLASCIRPEDIVKFSLIYKNAWTVTCTAAFWTRLYRRHYTLDASLPLRL